MKPSRLLVIKREAVKHATQEDFKIWGEEVPCTYFLGEDGLSEEKKKEMWIKVVSNDPGVQAWIDREIPYSKTIPNEIYQELILNPKFTL